MSFGGFRGKNTQFIPILWPFIQNGEHDDLPWDFWVLRVTPSAVAMDDEPNLFERLGGRETGL